MKSYWIRVFNALAIAGTLLGYNQVLQYRDKNEQLARIQAELATNQLAMEQLQADLLSVNAAYENSQISQDAQNAQEMTEAGAYKDGVYYGEAEGFGGTIAVEVSVSGGRISDISITEAEKEDGSFLEMAKEVLPIIIEAQDAEVDGISGATFSSNGIINAVKEALKEAVA